MSSHSTNFISSDFFAPIFSITQRKCILHSTSGAQTQERPRSLTRAMSPPSRTSATSIMSTGALPETRSQHPTFRVLQQTAHSWPTVPPIVRKVSHPVHKAIYSPLLTSVTPYSLIYPALPVSTFLDPVSRHWQRTRLLAGTGLTINSRGTCTIGIDRCPVTVCALAFIPIS